MIMRRFHKRWSDAWQFQETEPPIRHETSADLLPSWSAPSADIFSLHHIAPYRTMSLALGGLPSMLPADKLAELKETATKLCAPGRGRRCWSTNVLLTQPLKAAFWDLWWRPSVTNLKFLGSKCATFFLETAECWYAHMYAMPDRRVSFFRVLQHTSYWIIFRIPLDVTVRPHSIAIYWNIFLPIALTEARVSWLLMKAPGRGSGRVMQKQQRSQTLGFEALNIFDSPELIASWANSWYLGWRWLKHWDFWTL